MTDTGEATFGLDHEVQPRQRLAYYLLGSFDPQEVTRVTGISADAPHPGGQIAMIPEAGSE